jgi:hypothetical protein
LFPAALSLQEPNMKTVVIACRTIEDELNFALKKTGLAYPIEWIESGLHNTPKKLTSRIEELLTDLSADRVLMAFGYCGNSILGILTGNFQLIIPRVDDCISLLLGSIKARTKASEEHAAYFLTEGWMRGERNLWVEYQYTLEKYGEARAKKIAKATYGHYRTLGLLDAGVNAIEPLVESTKVIADTLNLEQKVLPATTVYLEELLTGPWPTDKFIVKSPGEVIDVSDLFASS